jgi:hypothetical protein
VNLDEEVWDATVFTKNRDRLLEAEVASVLDEYRENPAVFAYFWGNIAELFCS